MKTHEGRSCSSSMNFNDGNDLLLICVKKTQEKKFIGKKNYSSTKTLEMEKNKTNI